MTRRPLIILRPGFSTSHGRLRACARSVLLILYSFVRSLARSLVRSSQVGFVCRRYAASSARPICLAPWRGIGTFLLCDSLRTTLLSLCCSRPSALFPGSLFFHLCQQCVPSIPLLAVGNRASSRLLCAQTSLSLSRGLWCLLLIALAGFPRRATLGIVLLGVCDLGASCCVGGVFAI